MSGSVNCVTTVPDVTCGARAIPVNITAGAQPAISGTAPMKIVRMRVRTFWKTLRNNVRQKSKRRSAIRSMTKKAYPYLILKICPVWTMRKSLRIFLRRERRFRRKNRQSFSRFKNKPTSFRETKKSKNDRFCGNCRNGTNASDRQKRTKATENMRNTKNNCRRSNVCILQMDMQNRPSKNRSVFTLKAASISENLRTGRRRNRKTRNRSDIRRSNLNNRSRRTNTRF